MFIRLSGCFYAQASPSLGLLFNMLWLGVFFEWVSRSVQWVWSKFWSSQKYIIEERFDLRFGTRSSARLSTPWPTPDVNGWSVTWFWWSLRTLFNKSTVVRTVSSRSSLLLLHLLYTLYSDWSVCVDIHLGTNSATGFEMAGRVNCQSVSPWVKMQFIETDA